MDVFSDDALSADAPPAWLLGHTAATNTTRVAPTGVFSKLPPELLSGIFSCLPSESLANVACCASWCGPSVRMATYEAVERRGLRLPSRRLGEGWPCVLKRAELRFASRNSAGLSAGYTCAAWINPKDGMPHFVQLLDPLHPRWFPQPKLPRRAALAVSCGSLHALVLLDDGTVIQLELPVGPPSVESLSAADPAAAPPADPAAIPADGPATTAPGSQPAQLSGSSCMWRVLRPAAATLPHDRSGGGETTREGMESSERSVAISAGAFHSLIVGAKGTLWSSGSNACGQLGIGQSHDALEASSQAASNVGFAHQTAEGIAGGTGGHHSSYVANPTRVDVFHKALQVSGGGHHTLILSHRGGVLACGHGGCGQLGLGDTFSRSSPCVVPVPGGDCAVAVAAGGDFSLVLTEQGKIFGFGLAACGALGSPAAHASTAQKLPVRVPLPPSLGAVRVRQIAAGYDHALAVTSDGVVISWGSTGATANGGGPAIGAGNDVEGAAVIIDDASEAHPHDLGADVLWSAAQSPEGERGATGAVGQLGRHVPVTPNEDGQAGQDEEREGEVAFSSAPAVAYALGRCELVAAGSFCSIGRRLLGNDQNEAFGHEVLEYSGNDCPHVVLVKSAPPS